jgi:hypothetical protein
MSDDDVVMTVLVGASLAGPAILGATAMARRSVETPEGMSGVSGGHALLFLLGGTLTFFGWILLAGWIWLSNAHWRML